MKLCLIKLTSCLSMTSLCLALCVQLVPQSAFAQSNGKLKGMILDPVGAGIPAAKITIERKEFKREIVSADDGSYEVELPEGKYKVTVEVDAFYPTRRKGVEVLANFTTPFNITLKGMRVD